MWAGKINTVMIQTIDLRGPLPPAREIAEVVPRALLDAAAAVAVVEPLVTEVRNQGSAALRAQAERFDGVVGHDLVVPSSQLSEALDSCEVELRQTLELMIERLRKASEAQVPAEQITTMAPGATITQRWQPVDRVGLYAPGGKAVYPSSVLMNVVAAQTAGVSSIALASPIQQETGSVHRTILAAAKLLGVTEVYAMGGAGAIAAFAYGVPDIGLERVDMVTGPGNIYVAAAKRVVNDVVGIDAEAGTTEILIIADESAQAEYVAADLLSQAEHDEAAASVLITTSESLAENVRDELDRQCASAHHRERISAALRGPQSAIILVDTIEDAARVSNIYAPEHLELQVKNNAQLLELISNAGAIFVGDYSPVSLGDYLAGSNHVLPTGGTARYAAGLGAYTFLRPQQIVSYDRESLSQVSDALQVIAKAEGLPAHGAAVQSRDVN